MSERGIVELLAAGLREGNLNLFTGAGFSGDALDADGRALPTADELRRELWALCFPGQGECDESLLADLYSYALARCATALEAHLRRRLRVDRERLPEHYRTWLSLPWKRIYTLNVDDLETAVAERFAIPAALHLRTATAGDGVGSRDGGPRADGARALEVVKLNGRLEELPYGVTFSTWQYAERMARDDRWYRELGAALLGEPFVFVGTRLDEAPFWRHIEVSRSAASRRAENRPRSLIVSPRISRARAALLEELGIAWVPSSTREFAERYLAPLRGA